MLNLVKITVPLQLSWQLPTMAAIGLLDRPVSTIGLTRLAESGSEAQNGPIPSQADAHLAHRRTDTSA